MYITPEHSAVRLGEVAHQKSLSVYFECLADRSVLLLFEGPSWAEWQRRGRRFTKGALLCYDLFDDKDIRLAGDAGALDTWTESDGGATEPVLFYSMRAVRLALDKGRRYRFTAALMVDHQVQDEFPSFTVVFGCP